MPCLILINGQPCTGKSHLLYTISQDLDLPYISRDEFKEMLFDDLGVFDSEWSRRLGGASYTLLFNVLEKMLHSRTSFIVESNFSSRHKERLKKLIENYGFDTAEILLEAEPKILFKRFRERWESGERHKGHADHERFDEFNQRLQDKTPPLGLSKNLIIVNTNNFEKIDYVKLTNDLKKFI